MDREDFRKELASVLQLPPAELDDSCALGGEIWDSLAVLNTIALVDEQFGCSVPAAELESCTTVGQLLDTVARAATASVR